MFLSPLPYPPFIGFKLGDFGVLPSVSFHSNTIFVTFLFFTPILRYFVLERVFLADRVDFGFFCFQYLPIAHSASKSHPPQHLSEESNSRITALNDQLAASRHEAEMSAVRAEKIAELEGTLVESERNVNAQIEERNHVIEGLLSDNDMITRHVTTLECDAEAYKARIADLETGLARAKDQVSSSQNETEEAITDLKNSLESSIADVTRLEVEVSQAMTANQNLEQLVGQKELEIEQLAAEKEAISDLNSQFEAERHSLLDHIENLKNQVWRVLYEGFEVCFSQT